MRLIPIKNNFKIIVFKAYQFCEIGKGFWGFGVLGFWGVIILLLKLKFGNFDGVIIFFKMIFSVSST